jgi:hypothetical protein
MPLPKKYINMFTVEELVTQYEAYSDKELYDVHKNIEGYSAEAKEALEKVIRKRVLIGIVLSVILSVTIGMKLYEVIGHR